MAKGRISHDPGHAHVALLAVQDHGQLIARPNLARDRERLEQQHFVAAPGLEPATVAKVEAIESLKLLVAH